MTVPPQATLVLVHGTFATNATWVDSESPTAQFFKECAGFQEVVAFRWSGDNSAVQRRRAGIELRRLILAKAKHHSRAPVFVVAHSHGGTVALYAVRPAYVRRKIGGIITLSTPFIWATGRRDSAFVLSNLIRTVTVPAVLLGSAVAIPRYWWLILLPLLGLAMSVLIQILLRGIGARHLLRTSAYNRLGDRLLVARAGGDEASMALSLAQLVSWASVFLIRQEFTTKEILSIASIGRRLASFVFTPVLSVLGALCLLPFGKDLLWCYTSYEIVVEAVPIGKSTVVAVPIDVPGVSMAARHSSLYSEPDAASYREYLAGWFLSKSIDWKTLK